MNSKGQGLSMNTIILAALGLIVLVVLVAVFTGETGKVRLGLGEATDSAKCASQCQQIGPDYLQNVFSGVDSASGSDNQCNTGDGWVDSGLRMDKLGKCCCKLKA